jgi:hypothetical protein
MKRPGVWLTAALLISTASAVRADTITITGGSVDLPFANGLMVVNVTGPDTNLVATGANGTLSFAFNGGSVGPFSPNNLLFFSTFSTPDRPAERIGGTLFAPTDYVDGSLHFLLAPFHAPDTTSNTASFLTPFSMVGGLTVHDGSGAVLLNTSLAGGGEASLMTSVIHGAITQFSTQNISFQFAESTPSPAPEPTSIMLLGTGLVGIVLRRFRTA